MDNVLASRCRNAKQKAAYFAGTIDRHPHGESGKAILIPYENDKRCMDTSIDGIALSEWGTAAGIV